MCKRVCILNNTRLIILPPPSKSEESSHHIYAWCHQVTLNDNFCGEDGKLYEKYSETNELNIERIIPIMENGEYTADYLKKNGKYLRLS